MNNCHDNRGKAAALDFHKDFLREIPKIVHRKFIKRPRISQCDSISQISSRYSSQDELASDLRVAARFQTVKNIYVGETNY